MKKNRHQLRIEKALAPIAEERKHLAVRIATLQEEDAALEAQERFLTALLSDEDPAPAAEVAPRTRKPRKAKDKPADPPATGKYRCPNHGDIFEVKMKGDIPTCPECGEPVEEIAGA